MFASFADALASVLVLVGALFVFTAGLGLWRFRNVLERIHTASKPQVVGVLLFGVALMIKLPETTGIVLPVILFQLLTAPMASHMVARSAVRLRRIDHSQLVIDDLDEVLGEVDDPHGQFVTREAEIARALAAQEAADGPEAPSRDEDAAPEPPAQPRDT